MYNNDTPLKETVIYVDENFVRVTNSSGSYDYTYVMHEGQRVAQEMGFERGVAREGVSKKSKEIVENPNPL